MSCDYAVAMASAPPVASASDEAAPTPTPTEAAAAEMLEKIGRYVAGEVELSLADYQLLQAMNLATADRYGAMADYSAGLVAFAERLQSKCDAMTPQLAQVRVSVRVS